MVTSANRAPGIPSMVRQRQLMTGLVFMGLVSSVIGSLGAPLITPVAETYGVSLAAAQWTLTVTLLAGAVATPLLGRLGSGPHRRTAILGGLAVSIAGGVLTLMPAGPAGFALLVAGRGAQGVGWGLTALLMATARDHLGERANDAIAALGVVATAGVGVGYPIAGLLGQVSGVRGAYAAGLVFTMAAFVVAWRIIPAGVAGTEHPAPRRAMSSRTPSVDWLGALLLSAGLVGVLLAMSLPRLWISAPAVGCAVLVASLGLLAAWARVEVRTPRPVVDLSALRHPAVLGFNVITAAVAIGIYILFTVVTRYAQTPRIAGYGFGLDGFEAGLVIVPFSLAGFMTRRAATRMGRRAGPYVPLAASGLIMVAACCLFAVNRGNVLLLATSMTILGAGVGGFWSTLPPAIAAVTPRAETAPALSFNQVVRYTGFSVGSAISALVLASFTPSASQFPGQAGYTVTAWIAAGIDAVCVALVLAAAVAARRAAARSTAEQALVLGQSS